MVHTIQKALVAFVLGLLSLGFLLTPVVAVAQNTLPTTFSDGPVVVVEIDEEIRAGTVQFLQRSLREAEQNNAALFLVELNTPGGLLTATDQISRLLIDSAIPTAVYVHKDSGRAFSAGVYILLSADIAASHPTAVLGAAAPILATGGDADEKVRNATLIQLRSLAERNDRNSEIVEQFILENRTVTGTEAFADGVVDIVALSRNELLAELQLEENQVQQLQPTIVDATFSFFSIPYLVPLLLTLGSLGLFLAFRTGEIEVTGALSFILLLLGLWGTGAIQLSTFGVIVLVVGIALVVLEFFLGGADFGASGIVGLLAILFGIISFGQEPLFPDIISYGFFPVLIAMFLAGAAIMFGISYFTASAIVQPHKVGVETMVGREVVVKQVLNPLGVIWYEGERYTARTADESILDEGAAATIIAMEGNVAVVTKKE